MGQFMQRTMKDPTFAFLQTRWRPATPQLYVDVDREKAKALGVPLSELYGALAATLGNYYVNDFNKYGRTWQVLMSAEPQYRNSPGDVGDIYVRSERGEMIPLRSLANVRYASGPDSLTRFNNLPAVKLFGQAAPGVSSGQAIAEAERIASEVLPPEFSYDWGGASYQEKKSGGTSVIALGLAVIMVFLILAAQYERWSLPFSVLLALPFGTFGALAAVWLRGYSNDVYFQIGLVTLLGLAAKNAILIVQFAELKEREGLSAAAAALEAARLRFRPILMTSLAFIFGVMPLALSTGAQRQQNSKATANFFPGIPTQYSDYRATLNVSWEVDVFGRLRATASAARADLQASEAARDGVRLALAAQVAKSYFALRAFDEQLAMTRRNVSLREDALVLQRKRYNGGVISEYDLRQLEAETASVRAQLPPLERARDQEEAALAVLLGRSPKQIFEAEVGRTSIFDQSLHAAVVPAGMPSELLLRRPDLVEAERRLAAA